MNPELEVESSVRDYLSNRHKAGSFHPPSALVLGSGVQISVPTKVQTMPITHDPASCWWCKHSREGMEAIVTVPLYYGTVPAIPQSQIDAGIAHSEWKATQEPLMEGDSIND